MGEIANDSGDDAIQEHETRRLLLDLIAAKPGIHKSQLVREVGLAWGTVGHHLRMLQRMNLVRGFRMNGRLHLATGEFADDNPDWTTLLAPGVQRILNVLKSGQAMAPAEVQRRTGLPEKRVRRVLGQLVNRGVVRRDDGYHPRYWRPRQKAEAPSAAGRRESWRPDAALTKRRV